MMRKFIIYKGVVSYIVYSNIIWFASTGRVNVGGRVNVRTGLVKYYYNGVSIPTYGFGSYYSFSLD